MREEELATVIQRQLHRSEALNLANNADSCEKTRESETIALIALKDFLVRKGVVDPEKSILDATRCQLVPMWRGVLDLKDTTTDPSKIMTKPSIGWSCEPYECSIEADLPVPYAKRHEFKKELEYFDANHCAPTEIHIHEDPIAPEAHVHLVCKGIVSHELGRTVSRLARKTMRYRGHDIKDSPIDE